MLHIRSILHPTDFSDRSEHAFQLACALTCDYGARLFLLHVTPTPTVIAYGQAVFPPAPERLRQQAQEQLDRLKLPDVRVDRQLVEGDPAQESLRIAQEIGADLIVIGTHGRTGLARLVMGSVAEQIVRKAICPVLTVSNPFPTMAVAGPTLLKPSP